MTDRHNAEGISPVSMTGARAENQVPSEGPPKKDSSGQGDSEKAEARPNAEVHGVSERGDEFAGVPDVPDRHEQAEEKEAVGDRRPVNEPEEIKQYSVFTKNEKKLIVLCAGFCSFFSPISGQIYFPSLDAIATDLRVSYTLVNLTITTYMVKLFY